jgi:3-dehydroquinate synthase
MSTSDKLSVKSHVHDYEVTFTGDVFGQINADWQQGGYFLVDARIAALYADKLPFGHDTRRCMVIEALETNKALPYIAEIAERLVANNFKKGYRLCAVGGGIIQDIAGFVATILHRGSTWTLFPTTLLAQCDSCIGSKTSINLGQYKNQLGTFYPPVQIFLDQIFLTTLSPAELRSGLGEIIKVHFLDGPESFRYLQERFDRITDDAAVMSDFIRRSLSIKKGYIEKDEFDRDYRNLLNYGHTFGHALETLTDYALPHGQAVTVGMDISNFISMKLGLIDSQTYQIIREQLLKNWPSQIKISVDPERYKSALSKDKKNTDDRVKAILTHGPGQMVKKSIPMDAFLDDCLTDYFRSAFK